MKRAVLYTRVSTFDQNPETQALDLRRLAEQRGFEIVREYSDKISGTKAKPMASRSFSMLFPAPSRKCIPLRARAERRAK